MQQNRIFHLLKKLPCLMDHFGGWHVARLERKIHELHPMPLAGCHLQPVAAAIALAPEIDNGLDAFARKKGDLRRAGLRRAPNARRYSVPVRIDSAKNVVIDKE